MTDDEIKRIIKKHYRGNQDSLIAQLLFRFGREVSDITEDQTIQHDFDHNMKIAFKINGLEREVAILKGKEPPPELAYA